MQCTNINSIWHAHNLCVIIESTLKSEKTEIKDFKIPKNIKTHTQEHNTKYNKIEIVVECNNE